MQCEFPFIWSADLSVIRLNVNYVSDTGLGGPLPSRPGPASGLSRPLRYKYLQLKQNFGQVYSKDWSGRMG